MRIRRAILLQEDLSIFDDREVRAVRVYRQYLKSGGLFDFERIVEVAHWIVLNDTFACDRLAAKYPLILVDEYQDLGGLLHSLVGKLSSLDGVRLFCAGDPNQSIFGFNGEIGRAHV